MDVYVVYIHSGILFCHKKEWNNAICSNMDGSRDCHIEWSMPDKNNYCMNHLYEESKKKIQMNLNKLGVWD